MTDSLATISWLLNSAISFAFLFFHLENDDTTETKVFILKEDANENYSSEIYLQTHNQGNTTCQLKRENQPIRIPTACCEYTDDFNLDTSDTDSRMIVKGSSKAEQLKYNDIRHNHKNSIKATENLLLELYTETKRLENENECQRSGHDEMKPGMLN